MADHGASLLRSGAPTENPFLAFQPIPIPPSTVAPNSLSDDEVEPPEMSSRRNRHTTKKSSQTGFKSPTIKTRQVGSPASSKKTTSSSSSSSLSQNAGEAGTASTISDPFALSNFDWTSAASTNQSSQKQASSTNPYEEDFLGDFLAGTTTSYATNTVASNPFEEISDPFAAFTPTTNIFEPTPNAISSPPSPPQRTNSRRNKRRHTAPVGSIDSAVEKLRASKSNDSPSKNGAATPNRRGEIDEGDESDSDGDLEKPVVSPKAAAKQKSKSNLKRRNSEPVSQLHDCLSELHRGTALLKYGRRGYPHFRQFQLSSDNTQLQWFSKKKGIADSSIELREINEVRTGQTTPEFERVGWTSLAPASFSIVYANRTRRLSLVAKSVDEQKMWVEALRTLRDKARKGYNMQDLDQVLVHVDYRDRNRPQSRRHSGKFVRGHETNERNVDNLLHKKLIGDVGSLKERFRTVVASANHPTIMASDENESIRQILSELEERLEELEHEVRHTRDTKIAENDVWRTKVDLEALEEKIQVLIRPKRRWSIKRL